jgi:hypothetical protein
MKGGSDYLRLLRKDLEGDFDLFFGVKILGDRCGSFER